MNGLRRLMTGGAVLLMGLATLHAQTATISKTAVGAPSVTTDKIAGEVLYVEGNTLVAKVQPGGEIRTFNIRPGQQFTIDGQARLIHELKPGTVLNATVVTTTQPMTVRTVTVTNGTVWFVAGNSVILTLENGQNRQYTVPESYHFTVGGKPATVYELRKGMKVSGAKIVEAPLNEISSNAIITGKAPR